VRAAVARDRLGRADLVEPEYLWLKALHVIAVIAWMAGMLYLPRLFVYHSEASRAREQSETFKVMERRLLRAIINPAMIATWVLGLWLAWDGGGFRQRLAARQARAGRRAVRRARLAVAAGSRLRRRPQHAQTPEILSDR
jgi:hypothetical protein